MRWMKIDCMASGQRLERDCFVDQADGPSTGMLRTGMEGDRRVDDIKCSTERSEGPSHRPKQRALWSSRLEAYVSAAKTTVAIAEQLKSVAETAHPEVGGDADVFDGQDDVVFSPDQHHVAASDHLVGHAITTESLVRCKVLACTLHDLRDNVAVNRRKMLRI